MLTTHVGDSLTTFWLGLLALHFTMWTLGCVNMSLYSWHVSLCLLVVYVCVGMCVFILTGALV